MKKRFNLLVVLSFLLALFIVGVGCTSKKVNQNSSTDSPQLITPPPTQWKVQSELNQKLLQFNPKDISELTLIRVDPKFKENFSFYFKRTGNKELRPEDRWEIKSASHLNDLKDHFANGNWIDHFLDTLTTLTAKEIAGDAPLEHFGLEPPRYIIQVKNKSGESVEMHLGDTLNSPSSRWGRLPYLKEGVQKPMRYEGAAIQMLNIAQTAQFLRRERLLVWEADDIDIIRQTYKDRNQIEVEREGDGWVTLKTKKKTQSSINEWLKALTHLKAERFIETDAELKMILPLFVKPSKSKTVDAIEIQFTNRKNEVRHLEARIENQKIWVKLSSRPNVVFELHKDAIPTLRGP